MGVSARPPLCARTITRLVAALAWPLLSGSRSVASLAEPSQDFSWLVKSEAGQIELVRSGAVSARELVELSSLRRIERIDPELNAFVAVYGERALQQADEAAAFDQFSAGIRQAARGLVAQASFDHARSARFLTAASNGRAALSRVLSACLQPGAGDALELVLAQDVRAPRDERRDDGPLV